MNHKKYLRWILCCFLSGQDGHRGALTCLACNKDGTLVLTGSVDGYAKLINTATGKVGVTESAGGWEVENTLHQLVSVSARKGDRIVFCEWRQRRRRL